MNDTPSKPATPASNPQHTQGNPQPGQQQNQGDQKSGSDKPGQQQQK